MAHIGANFTKEQNERLLVEMCGYAITPDQRPRHIPGMFFAAVQQLDELSQHEYQKWRKGSFAELGGSAKADIQDPVLFSTNGTLCQCQSGSAPVKIRIVLECGWKDLKLTAIRLADDKNYNDMTATAVIRPDEAANIQNWRRDGGGSMFDFILGLHGQRKPPQLMAA